MLKGRIKKEDFNFVIEKMQARLVSWKLDLLNNAGRMTSAKFVLTSIPTYYMQVNWLSTSICDKMDQITMNFIWRRAFDKALNLVGWEKITQPKRLGRLGIRSAREANTAMLRKHVWDMQCQSDKLWVQMLSHKFVKGRSFLHTPLHYGSPIWNSIFKAKEVLKEGYKFRVAGQWGFPILVFPMDEFWTSIMEISCP